MLLFDAPHRAFFLAGLAQILLALLLWSLWLLGAFAGAYTPPALPVSAIPIHGFLMIFGIFPFFISGFLLTTYPRWMQRPPVARGEYRRPFLARAAGLVLVYVGLGAGVSVVIAGLALMMIGDALTTYALLRVYRGAAAKARRGVGVFQVAMAGEIVAIGLYASGLAHASPAAISWAIRLGLFGFLLPTLFAVGYRMIPFFSASVLSDYRRAPSHPAVPLAFFALGLAHVVFASVALAPALVVVDVALAALAGYHAGRWFRADAVRHGLLFLLFAAFVWLSGGLWLYAIHDASRAASGDLLGFAPLHALGIGFALSMVVAMVTRVTRGHSGRPLESDRLSWVALAGVQVAALLRIAASIRVIDAAAGINLSVIAAPVALLALSPWAVSYGIMLITPRLDGRPG